MDKIQLALRFNDLGVYNALQEVTNETHILQLTEDQTKFIKDIQSQQMILLDITVVSELPSLPEIKVKEGE